MNVGLIDVDGHNFPNLAAMKLSSWHRQAGDNVTWYRPGVSYGRVYVSKVFTFTDDVNLGGIRCDDILFGGTGYGLDNRLPDEVEHVMPDYLLYGDRYRNTAYGFLSRGCPRGCPFCIVSRKEGNSARKVADLSEWWSGQREIKLMDPNILACPDWEDLLGQLADSRALVDVTQGLDIRLMTDRKCDAINSVRTKMLHFAWDGLDDLEPLFVRYSSAIRKRPRDRRVYVLVNFNSDISWDVHRVYALLNAGYDPFIMVYNRTSAPLEKRQLQRWVNNKILFRSIRDFESYKKWRNGRV